MDERALLLAERDLLECRLLTLERTIEERREHGEASPELAVRMSSLFTRLKLVNELLAEMRREMT